MTNDSKSVFSQHVAKVPAARKEQDATIPRGPLLKPIVPPSDQGSAPAEKLLDFLVNRWPKPAVRVRDILQFGPPAARNRKSAIALAKTLEASGWLSPVAGLRQHNMKMWQVVRGPSQ